MADALIPAVAEVRESLAKLDAEVKAAQAAFAEKLAGFGAEGVAGLQRLTAATGELAAAQRQLGEVLALNAKRARDILRPPDTKRL